MAGPLGLDRPGGIIVSGLHPVSPFRAAGLEVGDVITHVDGQPVHTPAEMIYRMSVAGLGKTAMVTHLRRGAARDVAVALIAAPEAPARDERVLDDRSLLPGLTLGRINPAVISELNLPLETQGVAVLDAGPLGPRVGVQSGDVLIAVNGTQVAHPDEVARLLDGRLRRIEMVLQRGNRRLVLRFQV
jgi:S1-C subfamily serine protease